MFTIDKGKSKIAHKIAVKRVTDWINDVIQPRPPAVAVASSAPHSASAAAVGGAGVDKADNPPSFVPGAPRPPSYPPPRFMIMVSEIQCTEPDCVPIETLVAVMENDPDEPFDAVALVKGTPGSRAKGRRWIEKILKPVAEVTLRDIFQLDVLLELGTDEVDVRGMPIHAEPTEAPVRAGVPPPPPASTLSTVAHDKVESLTLVKNAIMDHVLRSSEPTKPPAHSESTGVGMGAGSETIQRFDDIFKLVSDLKTEAVKAYSSVNAVPSTAGAPTVIPMKPKVGPAVIVSVSESVPSVNALPAAPMASATTQVLTPPVPPLDSRSSSGVGSATVPTVVPMKTSAPPKAAGTELIMSKNQNKGKVGIPGLSAGSAAIPPQERSESTGVSML